MHESREVVDSILRNNEVVYGLSTGFGNFSNVVIPHSKLEEVTLAPPSYTQLGVLTFLVAAGEPYPLTCCRAGTLSLTRKSAHVIGSSD